MRAATRCSALFLAAALTGLGAPTVETRGAEQTAAQPDFSSNFAGWVGLNGGGPFYESGRASSRPRDQRSQISFRAERSRNSAEFPHRRPSQPEHQAVGERGDEEGHRRNLAGKKSAFTAQSSCLPAGVPFFMGYGGPDPIVFLQTPKEVWMIWTEDNQTAAST
jgi:hypothetical protein